MKMNQNITGDERHQGRMFLIYWTFIVLLQNELVRKICALSSDLILKSNFDVHGREDLSWNLNSFEAKLDEAETRLKENNFVFLEGQTVRSWLIHYGASEDDLTAMENGKIHSILERDYSPAMYFRDVAIQRNLFFDNLISENGEIQRALRHSGVRSVQRLQKNEVASSSKDGAKVEVKRSGVRQFWPIPPKEYVNSTVPYAFSRLMENFIDHFKGVNMTNKDSKVTIQDQILVRINKRTDQVESPTPEGIHQDAQEIVGITLTSFSNIESGGETRIWPLQIPKGNYDEKDFENPNSPFYKENCFFNQPLRNHWDTILFNDRMVKHEAREFDGKRPAYRDVIINQLRKPFSDGVDQMLNEKGMVVSIN